MNLCEECGYLHYRTDPCREPKKSTAARKDVRETSGTGSSLALGHREPSVVGDSINGSASSKARVAGSTPAATAGTQTLPVDTTAGSANGRTAPLYGVNAGSTPAPASKAKFNRAEWYRNYMKLYMRDRRAKAKENKQNG